MSRRTRLFLFMVIMVAWLIALAISPTTTTMLIGGVGFALFMMYGTRTKKQPGESLINNRPEGE